MNLPYYSASALISLLRTLFGWVFLVVGGMGFLIFCIVMFADGKCTECEERDAQNAEIERVEKARVAKIKVEKEQAMEQSDEPITKIP